MEEKKTTALPGNAGPTVASPLSSSSGQTGVEAAVPQKKRRGPSPGTGKDESGGKGRVKKNASDLKFEAIRVLSNLPDEGKFFLVVETPEGEKNTLHCWS